MSFVTESLGMGRNALAQKGYYGWACVRVGLECWRGVALKDSRCEAVKVTQSCMCSNSQLLQTLVLIVCHLETHITFIFILSTISGTKWI